MKWNHHVVRAVGVTAATSLLFACGPEQQEVDHRSAQQALEQNTRNVARAVSEALTFLEESSLFMDGFDRAFNGEANCAATPADDGFNNDFGGDFDDDFGFDDDCFDEPVAFDPDLEPHVDELVELLNTYVFADGNIEASSGTSVTYLMRGPVVCQIVEDVEEREECVDSLDRAEIRLVVTSPAAGDVNVRVQVGPRRHNPIDLEFHRNQLAIEPDLGGVKATLTYLAETFEVEDLDLPTTFSGRARLAVRKDAANKFTLSAAVQRAINIAEGDFELSVAASPQAFTLSADGAAATLRAAVDLGALTALVTATDDDAFECWGDDLEDGCPEPAEPADPIRYGFKLGGLSASALFEASEELLRVTNIGLGTSASSLDVNGERVLTVDLNASSGRTFDLEVQADDDDGARLTVSPGFDLRVAFELARARDVLDDVAEWMLDEVLTIKLDGAERPTLRGGDGGLEVLAGRLTLTAEKAGITHVVDANQCLIGEDGDADGSGDDFDDFDDDSHPFENFSVGTCG